MPQLESHKLHNYCKCKYVFETCLQVLQSTRYPKNFNFTKIFLSYSSFNQYPPLGWFNIIYHFFDIPFYQQISYKTSKYCTLFQFISPPLNHFVTITKVKLSSNHIFKLYLIASIINLQYLIHLRSQRLLFTLSFISIFK